MNTTREPKSSRDADRFVTDLELEKITGMSRKFWQKLRNEVDASTGQAPPYYKIGRACRYKLSEVLEWIEQRKTTSTTAHEA